MFEKIARLHYGFAQEKTKLNFLFLLRNTVVQ